MTPVHLEKGGTGKAWRGPRTAGLPFMLVIEELASLQAACQFFTVGWRFFLREN